MNSIKESNTIDVIHPKNTKSINCDITVLNTNQFKTFLSSKYGYRYGEFLSEFKYFNTSDLGNGFNDTPKTDLWFVALNKAHEPEINNEPAIVGLSFLGTNPHKSNSSWLQYLSVHPSVQKKGISKQMVDAIVSYYEKNQAKSLFLSSFSPTGLKYLYPYFKNKVINSPTVNITCNKRSDIDDETSLPI